MNYAGFKKVHEDENKAVLKNSQGHSLTIAKKVLSKEHLDGLKKLPLHAAHGVDTSARGATDSWDDDEDSSDNQSSNGQPININIGGAPPAQPQPSYDIQPPAQQGQSPAPQQALAPQQAAQPQQRVPYGATDSWDDDRQTASNDNNPPASDDANQAVDNAPAPTAQSIPSTPPIVADPGVSPELHASMVKNNLDDQAAKVAQDYNNGHITPKTYGDLFHDRGTLGKIGTVFGLLLSGAGSGLAHQPNMAFQVMDNEIQRDLEAQKASKPEQRNFINMNLARMKQNSDIALQGKQGQLYQAQALEAKANAQLLAHRDSINQMTLAALHNLGTNVDNIPPNSPLKGPATQTLQQVGAAAANKISQGNAITAQAVSQVSQQAKKQFLESDYTKKIQDLKNAGALGQMSGSPGGGALTQRAEDMEHHLLPGIGVATRDVSDQGLDRARKFNEFEELMQEATGLNQKLGRAGGWTPYEKRRAAQVHNDLVTSYNDVKGLVRFTGNEEKAYKKIVPDSGELNLTNSTAPLLQDLSNSVSQRKQIFYKSLGITPFTAPNGEQQQGKNQTQGQTIERIDPKTGNTVIYDAKTKKALGWKK